MTTINNLSQIDSLSSGDQVPVYDADNGDARKASMAKFLAFFRANFASPDFDVTISSPIAGFNQQLASSSSNIWLLLTPAGTLATGTITLPAVADLFDGQEVLVTSTQQITALTVAGNGATVSGAPALLGANSAFRLRYNLLLTTWYVAGAYSKAAFDSIVNNTVAGTTTINGLDELHLVGDAGVFIDDTATFAGDVFAESGVSVGRAVAVASLPSAATYQNGRLYVTDANATTFASIVAGGGANYVPVYSDGTNWRIG